MGSAGGRPLRDLVVTRTAVILDALTPDTNYWVQVQALDLNSVPIGDPSPELKVRTLFPLPAPAIRATARSSVRIDLAWAKPFKGTRLQLEWKAPRRKARSTTPAGIRMTKSGLSQGTTYRVRARLIRHGEPQSAWTAVTVKTPDGDPLRVGSYNIQCANCRAWTPRRAGVAATIVNSHLDVVGLQEASPAQLKGSPRSQFEDLAALLSPSNYRLTDLARFNCQRSTTIKNCRQLDRGASGAVRIAYNRDTVRLISHGSRQLADLPGIGKDRFVTWAVFEHRINGKRFLFSSTHLEPRNDIDGSRHFYTIRNAQTRQVVRTIKSKANGLPVIAVGDYNSTKWDVPSNAPYDIMRAAGYVDPLGNGYRSTTSTTAATVEKRINTQYASYNALRQPARRTDGPNGSNPDYIFVSPMRVLEYATVLSVDRAGFFTRTPPSDHNLIRATTLLP